MTPERFAELSAAGYNRIPIVREVFADLDTPLSTYLKLAEAPYTYLLESVQGGEQWGRFSFIGLACRTVLCVDGKHVTVSTDGAVIEEATPDDPLTWIADFAARYRVPELRGLPRFNGGLVGYFGYDTVRLIEPRLGTCPHDDPLGLPDILLMVSEEVLAFDNLRGRLSVIVHADPSMDDAYARAVERAEDLAKRLSELALPPPARGATRSVTEADFSSEYGHNAFMDGVRRCKQYIVDGDAMQIVLSQRMKAPFDGSPLNLYRALRGVNPSPYMFYLNLSDFHIIGSSPEILTRVEDNQITVRPLAGTRPRGRDAAHDKALEKELLADEKELAEHLMLIDLGRNDVGRVAETGTVEVSDQMTIERYSHVMHIVSNVNATLRRDVSAMDALAATFPAGTLSGAPKVRAMEILDEMETVKRGVYSGAVGYLGWNGAMDTAIAIRTAVVKDGTLYVQAGAGIVADSDPESEWQETLSKARALFRAAELATGGLMVEPDYDQNSSSQPEPALGAAGIGAGEPNR
ncbi:MAG: anthranilate synthase component I [Pseudomonadota bacterium]